MPNLSGLLIAVLIIASLTAILLIAVFVPTVPVGKFTIETTSAVCLSQENEIQIKAVGGSIVIIAPMQTPNPCYSAVGDVGFSGKDIKVELSAAPTREQCIQCIGEVTGRVIIRNLTKGSYGVDVRTPDTVAITTVMIE